MRRRRLFALLAAAALLKAAPAAALTPQEELVEKSRLAIQGMLTNPEMPRLDDFVREARAVLIVPEMLKAGFFFGGEGGRGVLLVRQLDGSWGYPAFYRIGGASFGLQFGGQVSQFVLSIMTEQGLNALLERQVTLGADASLALATEGFGVDARTGIDLNADMYAFTDAQGLFLGGAIEGSIVAPDYEWNQRYYGPAATPQGVLVGHHINAHADALRAALPR